MGVNLSTDIMYLGGVGPKKAELLRKELNIYIWNALTSISDTVVGVSMGESIKWSQILGVVLIVCGILLV